MRAGKCRLVYVRFAPTHGLARRVPDTVLAGTGTLCRWMIALCAAGKSFVSQFRHREKRLLCASIISRSAVDHDSDKAGEFFVIHVHFLSNKKRATHVFLHR